MPCRPLIIIGQVARASHAVNCLPNTRRERRIPHRNFPGPPAPRGVPHVLRLLLRRVAFLFTREVIAGVAFPVEPPIVLVLLKPPTGTGRHGVRRSSRRKPPCKQANLACKTRHLRRKKRTLTSQLTTQSARRAHEAPCPTSQNGKSGSSTQIIVDKSVHAVINFFPEIHNERTVAARRQTHSNGRRIEAKGANEGSEGLIAVSGPLISNRYRCD